MFSPEDLEKPARFDMELFKPVKEEFPKLSVYEDMILDQLRAHYLMIGKLVAHGGDIYASTLAVNGALVRSLNVYRGALWALGNRNPHVLSDCIRSQCETLAFVHYCVLNPDYIKAAVIGERNHPQKDLKIPNILTMVEKVDKVHKGVLHDYNLLCDFVHPNPQSLYASIQPLDEKCDHIYITTRSTMTEDKAKSHLIVLVTLTSWILEEIMKFAQIFWSDFAKSP